MALNPLFMKDTGSRRSRSVWWSDNVSSLSKVRRRLQRQVTIRFEKDYENCSVRVLEYIELAAASGYG